MMTNADILELAVRAHFQKLARLSARASAAQDMGRAVARLRQERGLEKEAISVGGIRQAAGALFRRAPKVVGPSAPAPRRVAGVVGTSTPVMPHRSGRVRFRGSAPYRAPGKLAPAAPSMGPPPGLVQPAAPVARRVRRYGRGGAAAQAAEREAARQPRVVKRQRAMRQAVPGAQAAPSPQPPAGVTQPAPAAQAAPVAPAAPAAQAAPVAQPAPAAQAAQKARFPWLRASLGVGLPLGAYAGTQTANQFLHPQHGTYQYGMGAPTPWNTPQQM